MKTTKHTYAIKSFGATKADEHSISVEWPETLDGIVEAVGKERVYSMLVGFIAAHHVQSKIKSAFGAEKPSDEQKALKARVTGQFPLKGVEFIPAERGNGDDSVIKKLREAADDGRLTDEKIDELATRWGGEAADLDELVEVYREWKKSQKVDLGL